MGKKKTKRFGKKTKQKEEAIKDNKKKENKGRQKLRKWKRADNGKKEKHVWKQENQQYNVRKLNK